MLFGPSTKYACVHVGTPASSTWSSRPSSSRKMARISRRARCAPRQKCRPKPNATWPAAFSREHVEPVGIGEHLLVAVRRRVREVREVARLERDVAQRERLLRGAAEVLHRRHVADDLVGRRLDQLGTFLQQRELIGELHQREQAAGDRVRRGVVTGGGDDHVVAEHVEVGQRARRRARRWRSPTPGPRSARARRSFGELREVVHEVHEHAEQRLRPRPCARCRGPRRRRAPG